MPLLAAGRTLIVCQLAVRALREGSEGAHSALSVRVMSDQRNPGEPDPLGHAIRDGTCDVTREFLGITTISMKPRGR